MTLAPTPPMGWNTWNTFGRDIDESLIIETAEALRDEGLQDAGYEYVVIDDVWQAPERVDGRLAADPDRFAKGLPALTDHLHDAGFKAGIYSCAGTHTCEELPASFGYEHIDAATFAGWGFDFLKYDFCHVPAGAHGPSLYRRMGQALRATGRPIVFSACEWGTTEPWTWGSSVGAHMWRTTGDIFDTWDSIVEIGFSQADLHPYAGPGHWNDPDMLVVGMYGSGNVGRGGCTDAEYRAHFSLWCLLAAPLMIGCDVRSMTDATRAILGNREAIAVNQDPLGRQGVRLGATHHALQPAEVWAKPLADGSHAVGLFNLSDADSRLIQVSWEALGLAPGAACTVRDLWAGEDAGRHTIAYETRVDSHDVALLRITPA